MRRNPVAWLSALAALLTAADGSSVVLDLLTPKEAAWLGLAAGLATLALGALTRSKVTPVASPRAADGEALVRESGSKLPPAMRRV